MDRGNRTEITEGSTYALTSVHELKESENFSGGKGRN